MNSADLNKLEIGPGLKFTFALLIALILVGNGVLLWQFRLARLQTERLEDVSQELIGVLRLQVSLLSVHQRLDELAQSKDAGGIAAESEPLRRNLLEEAQGEMTALTRLPYETHVEPEFQPTLQAIEITLPTQLDAIDGLASSGDWKALRLRLDNELKPVESLCASLVGGTDQEVRAELALAVADMRRAQLRIFVVVQATAISTFFVAAVLGGAVTRRIIILRVNERVAERTRIARDLHDTMLQSFQGLMLHFQTGIDLLPERPVEARKTLEIAVDRADQAINEGRDAVQGLRASAVETNDLVSAVRILGEELGAADTNQNSVVFEVEVEGVARNLHPILRDEVYRIAAEALRNAFQHAHAQRIEVEILYGERWLRLRVRDDGKGIEPKFLSEDGRAKHYGLHGMRERAQLVGGKLAVWSKLDSGTEVDLSIPASTAYATSYRRRSWLSEKFSRRGTNGKETDVKETKMKS
ncbi:MAG: histidine kinase [Terriglobales bacterium]